MLQRVCLAVFLYPHQARRQDFAAGGAKTTRGATSFKYGGKHKMEGTYFKRGPDTNGPPLATALILIQQCFITARPP